MARTRRRTLEDPVNDGKIGLLTLFARDHRATGLRDHRRDRREAKLHLDTGNEGTVVNGKRRKYSNHRGGFAY